MSAHAPEAHFYTETSQGQLRECKKMSDCEAGSTEEIWNACELHVGFSDLRIWGGGLGGTSNEILSLLIYGIHNLKCIKCIF